MYKGNKKKFKIFKIPSNYSSTTVIYCATQVDRLLIQLNAKLNLCQINSPPLRARLEAESIARYSC